MLQLKLYFIFLFLLLQYLFYGTLSPYFSRFGEKQKKGRQNEENTQSPWKLQQRRDNVIHGT